MLLSLTLGLALLAPQDSDVWPRFRGANGAGVATGTATYPERLSDDNQLWRTAVPAGDSSPCIVGDALFVTGVEGQQLITVCLERRSGKPRWKQALEVPRLERTQDSHGPASPSPCADGERVYVYFGSFGLVAYTHAGEEAWRRELPLPGSTFGTATSPILAGGRLVFVNDQRKDSYLEALDPATGETVWRKPREGFGPGWSTPAVWQRGAVHELLVYGAERLVAYDLKDGSERWSLPGLTDEPIITPVTGAGLVFLSSYNMKTNPEVLGLPTFAELLQEHDADKDGLLDREEAKGNKSILSRFDADGEGDHPLSLFFRMMDGDRNDKIEANEYQTVVDWVDGFSFANGLLAVRPGDPENAAELAWIFERGVPECPSPLYLDGRIFMVKNGGIATCLDAKTGELQWTCRTGARGPHYASLISGGGRVYSASARGQVAVFSATGEVKSATVSELGERLTATPALVDGVVYVRTQSAVRAFGK